MGESTDKATPMFNQIGIDHLIDEGAVAGMERYLNEPVDVPRVSSVEPDLFPCTRTWQETADPQLSKGDVVDVGGTLCAVTDKRISADGRFVTYQFSPAGL